MGSEPSRAVSPSVTCRDFVIDLLKWDVVHPCDDSTFYWYITVEARNRTDGSLHFKKSFQTRANYFKNYYLDLGKSYKITVRPWKDSKVWGDDTPVVVFEKLTPFPSREIDVSNDALVAALERLRNHTPNEKCKKLLKVKKTNILVISSVGSGKSSFVNSCLSLLKGDDVSAASSYKDEDGSLTKKVERYPAPQWSECSACDIRFYDAWGWIEGRMPSATNLKHMLNGRLPLDYFEPAADIADDAEVLRKGTTFDDNIHVVGILITEANVESEATQAAFVHARRTVMGALGIPVFLLLTKIDRILVDERDETMRSNPEKIFWKGEGVEKFNNAVCKSGFTPEEVLPVVNLQSKHPDKAPLGQKILLADALTKMLHRANDFMTHRMQDIEKTKSEDERSGRSEQPSERTKHDHDMQGKGKRKVQDL